MSKYTGKRCRLTSMTLMTVAFFFVEIVIGYMTNCMSLLADSFHMMSDIMALSIAFWSVRMSSKKWAKNTFGWARAEVLGALVNSVFLVAMCFSITIEALKRFLENQQIVNPQLVVGVGILGLVVNIIGIIMFYSVGHAHSHGLTPSSRLSHQMLAEVQKELEAMTQEPHEGQTPLKAMEDAPKMETTPLQGRTAEQMGMKGVFLHVLADALGSFIVIVSALIVWLSDWKYKFYVDPALSLIMVFIILYSAWPLLCDSSLILLQTVPNHIVMTDIEKRLLAAVEGILGVHEFHIWQLTGDRIIATAHIRCRNLSEYMKIAEEVKEFFHNEGIHSTTIQPEFTELEETKPVDITDCMLDCPNSDFCYESTCCGANKERIVVVTSPLDSNVVRRKSFPTLDFV